MNTFEWLETTKLGEWVGYEGYSLALTTHSIGLAVVVGILFMVNLRILGCCKSISFAPFPGLIRLAWAGFVINFISGVGLFVSQATVFISSTPFLIKIGFILLAGINAAFMQKALRLNAENWDSGLTPVSQGIKNLAFFSIVCWAVAIIAGRMIAYL